MSSKIQIKPLLAKNMKVSEHHLVSNQSNTFNAYQDELESNLKIILKKYPHLDKKKVRDLLEELGNNQELAIQILKEEQSHCNDILEEKKGSKRQLNLSKDEENQILKQSFLNLYKKLLVKTAEFEQMQKKYQSEKQENEKLKQLNRYLLEGEYSRASQDNFTPIY